MHAHDDGVDVFLLELLDAGFDQAFCLAAVLADVIDRNHADLDAFDLVDAHLGIRGQLDAGLFHIADRIGVADLAVVVAVVIGKAHRLDRSLGENLGVAGLAPKGKGLVCLATARGKRALQVDDSKVVFGEDAFDALEKIPGALLGVHGVKAGGVVEGAIGTQRAIASSTHHNLGHLVGFVDLLGLVVLVGLIGLVVRLLYRRSAVAVGNGGSLISGMLCGCSILLRTLSLQSILRTATQRCCCAKRSNGNRRGKHSLNCKLHLHHSPSLVPIPSIPSPVCCIPACPV